MSRIHDLRGKRFGRLLVVEFAGLSPRYSAKWLCKCDCGNEKVMLGSRLVYGAAKSCGCLQREKAKTVRYKHGKSGTRLYRIWNGMVQRCNGDTKDHVRRYLDRGITVCAEWRGEGGFENFEAWALSNGYSDNLTLDRIDNDGNYEPSNCRFATVRQQANNRVTSRKFTYKGETHTIAEWARILDISEAKLRDRLRSGKTFEKAIIVAKEI